MPRLHCPVPLAVGQELALPAAAARHAQVLRLQPGDALTLFTGAEGAGEFTATVQRMGRSDVWVSVQAHHATEREPAHRVHLAVAMPANDRMDWLVEKATELGVASLQPLLTERTVLRLSGERADKKVAHWQAVAVAACEQCGGNRVPRIEPVRSLPDWLSRCADQPAWRALLSLNPPCEPLAQALPTAAAPVDRWLATGPEGGWSAAEEAALRHAGHLAVSLGARVLRAETAAIVALALAL